jgi:nucleotide-binding universal stress UspA family protein
VPEVRAVVSNEPPTEAILGALPADVIVLVTDVHAGLASWYDPSTAQSLLNQTDLTLLLIREL